MLPLEDGLQVSDIHVSCVEDATAAALSRICTEQGLHDTALFHVPAVTDPVLLLVLPAGSRAHRTPSCQARGQDTRIPGHRAYNSGPAAPGRVNVVGIPQCWWGGFARHVPCHSSPPTADRASQSAADWHQHTHNCQAASLHSILGLPRRYSPLNICRFQFEFGCFRDSITLPECQAHTATNP